MNKVAHPYLMILACIGLGACGQQSAPPASQAKQQAQQTEPTMANNQGAEPAAEANSEQADQSNVTLPEAASETDDEPPVVDATPTTAQSSLRMGGPASGPPTSARFKEGTNYQKIVPAQPTSVSPGKVEVVEVFWYGCGHCFALDPAIESWRGKGKPGFVEFVRVPAMWNDATRMHARLFYTAESLGKLEELHSLIFREINVKGNPLNTVEKITAFFREHGVSTDEFQKAFSSFGVESKMQKADFLNRRYKVESVPSLVVNGKYKTDVSMAGGEQQLFGMIGEIAASEHSGS